jgi:hypothetical protein
MAAEAAVDAARNRRRVDNLRFMLITASSRFAETASWQANQAAGRQFAGRGPANRCAEAGSLRPVCTARKSTCVTADRP